MGLRTIVVVCTTSFLLGCLFTHWIVDLLTLWRPPAAEVDLWTAVRYYSLIETMPRWSQLLLGLVVSLAGATILWSLGDGQADNIMFDGGSICLFGATLAMYVYNVLPSIIKNFETIPPHEPDAIVPKTLRTAVIDLASNHLMCSVALTGVLALQAGRQWVQRSAREDQEEVEELVSDSK
ncbi:uncharacterized protein SCHCODRAFT_02682678 [Schizophyllum commune H4-8]|uniref:Shr3 amino acid permease chaperone n=1 Tax=Schizophyllum commune (strain H4-8 / FGSC 9210) TaxID=578458 RepID=D8PX40_SCHCM|nr:uncharacterized protein SCHCODRAFT_02682678 [Schizophyllum commune H4-8]KAI5899699.1 hypothetical protein SCHCODRAFT_02682678 [Schizophyllum commune H4-8]